MQVTGKWTIHLHRQLHSLMKWNHLLQVQTVMLFFVYHLLMFLQLLRLQRTQTSKSVQRMFTLKTAVLTQVRFQQICSLSLVLSMSLSVTVKEDSISVKQIRQLTFALLRLLKRDLSQSFVLVKLLSRESLVIQKLF